MKTMSYRYKLKTYSKETGLDKFKQQANDHKLT